MSVVVQDLVKEHIQAHTGRDPTSTPRPSIDQRRGKPTGPTQAEIERTHRDSSDRKQQDVVITGALQEEEEENGQDVQDVQQQRLVQDCPPWQQPFTGVTVGKASVDIVWQDLNLLRHEEWLNDNLVVGSAILMAGEARSSQRLVYAFSSHFLSRSLSTGTFDYKWVKSWKKQADIFRYNYVLFPICQNHHWYFVVVCHLASWRASQRPLGHLDTSPSRQESSDAIRPMLLILDPLAQQRPEICYILKKYLKLEAQNKEDLLLQDSDIDIVVAGCLPHQRNNYDCGVDTLAYWELFCHNPANFVRHTIQDHRSSRDRVSSKPCTKLRADARQRLCDFLRRQYDRQARGQPLNVPTRDGLLVQACLVESSVNSHSRSIEPFPIKLAGASSASRPPERVLEQYDPPPDRNFGGVRWRLQLNRLGRSIRKFVDAYLDQPLHVAESPEPQALADIQCLRAAIFGTDEHDCGALNVFSPPVRDYIQTCAFLCTAVMLKPQEYASSLALRTQPSRAPGVHLSQKTDHPLAGENDTSAGTEASGDPTDHSHDTPVDRFWNLLPHLKFAGPTARPGQATWELRALLEQAFDCGHILQDALATNPEYRLSLPCHGDCFDKTTMAEVRTAQTGGELVAMCLQPGIQVASSKVVVRPAVVTMQLQQCRFAVQGFPDAGSDVRVIPLKDISFDSVEERLGSTPAVAKHTTNSEQSRVAGEAESRQLVIDLTDYVAAPRGKCWEDDALVSAFNVRKSPQTQQLEPKERPPWPAEFPRKRKRLSSGVDDATQVSSQQTRKCTV